MKSNKNDDKWFEISKDIIYDFRKPAKKPRFLADADIPLDFVKEVRSAGIPIISVYELGIEKLEDPEIYQRARKMRRILVTMDGGFWNDQKYPIHIYGGIIYLVAGPSQINKALHSFGCIWSWFARYFPAQGWESMKVKATGNGFMIKMHNFEGRNIGYEIKGDGGRVFAREIALF